MWESFIPTCAPFTAGSAGWLRRRKVICLCNFIITRTQKVNLVPTCQIYLSDWRLNKISLLDCSRDNQSNVPSETNLRSACIIGSRDEYWSRTRGEGKPNAPSCHQCILDSQIISVIGLKNVSVWFRPKVKVANHRLGMHPTAWRRRMMESFVAFQQQCCLKYQ